MIAPLPSSYTPTPDDAVGMFVKQFVYQYEDYYGHSTANPCGKLEVETSSSGGSVRPIHSVRAKTPFALLRMSDYVMGNSAMGNLSIKQHGYYSLATHILALSLASRDLNETVLMSCFRSAAGRDVKAANSYKEVGYNPRPIYFRLSATHTFGGDGREAAFFLGNEYFVLPQSPNILIPISSGEVKREVVNKLRDFYVNIVTASNAWRSAMMATNLLLQGSSYIYGREETPMYHTDFDEVPF